MRALILLCNLFCVNALIYKYSLAHYMEEAEKDNQYVATELAEVVTVTVDSTAFLPCAKPPNGSHTVVWIGPKSKILAVDDTLTQSGLLIRVVRKSSDVPTLRIKDVHFEDQGIYKCQIISENPIVKQIFLVVQVPPKIDRQNTKSHISVYEGELGILQCPASGIPPPNVLWYKISGQTKNALKKGGEVHDIIPMSESDAGIYECVASNGVGETDHRQITVEYLPYPSFVEPGTENIIVQEGQTAVLPCFVQNLGEFEVWWYKRYDVITSGTNTTSKRYSIEQLSSNDYSLKIDSVRSDDAGEYRCGIKTDQRLFKYVNLKVEDQKPDGL